MFNYPKPQFADYCDFGAFGQDFDFDIPDFDVVDVPFDPDMFSNIDLSSIDTTGLMPGDATYLEDNMGYSYNPTTNQIEAPAGMYNPDGTLNVNETANTIAQNGGPAAGTSQNDALLNYIKAIAPLTLQAAKQAYSMANSGGSSSSGGAASSQQQPAASQQTSTQPATTTTTTQDGTVVSASTPAPSDIITSALSSVTSTLTSAIGPNWPIYAILGIGLFLILRKPSRPTRRRRKKNRR